MLTISDSDFIRLVKYIKSNYGIDLSKKRQLIAGRLSNTLMAKGYTDFKDYVDHIIRDSDAKEVELMINKLTTNYTYFMRESEHFDYLKSTVLPWLESVRKDRVLSIWSAGCSSGQEPYTLSMVLNEYFGSRPGKWDTRVLATDISQKVLTNAQNAVYEEEELSRLPASWKTKYFSKGPEPGSFVVSQDIRSNVIFRTFNLMEPIRFRRKFDIIFCRNVMIYFDQDTKNALVRRFFEATNPGGYLFISHSESLMKNDCQYRYIKPSIYRKE